MFDARSDGVCGIMSGVRRLGGIAVVAAAVMLAAGCTSSAPARVSPTEAVATVSVQTPTPAPSSPSVVRTSSAPVAASTTPVVRTSPAPATPTLPADVPTTGPNTKRGERPPVMPIEATKHTAAGARAFAEFYLRALDWGYATMSGAYIRHYSAPKCTSCRSVADQLDAARRAGHRYIGGRSTVLRAHPGRGGAFRSQIVAIDSTAFEEVDRAGKFVTADVAYRGQQFDCKLTWRESRWAVTDILIIR